MTERIADGFGGLSHYGSHGAPEAAQDLHIHSKEVMSPVKTFLSRKNTHNTTSSTWTSSGGDEHEEERDEDRTPFIQEYNRLAKKVLSLIRYLGAQSNLNSHSMGFPSFYLMD